MSKYITNLDMHDVPSLSVNINYYDGEIAFADSISSIPDLQRDFKVNFVAYVFCLNGTLNVSLNSKAQVVNRYDALFVGPNTVVSSAEHSDDFECKIIAVSTDVGIQFINKTFFDTIMKIQEKPVLHFTPDEIGLMIHYYSLAKFKMEHRELNYGKETMLAILRGFALDLLSCIHKHTDPNDENILRQGDKLYRRFILLLAANDDSKRSVQAFAEELCVSPKYLTSICTQKASKTASQLIAESMTAKIKQMLLYSEMTIKEIAAELNFGNLSFFGKYVKKHLGTSPNNYRKINGYGK